MGRLSNTQNTKQSGSGRLSAPSSKVKPVQSGRIITASVKKDKKAEEVKTIQKQIQVQTKANEELKKMNVKQGTLANLPSAIKETGVKFAKGAFNFLTDAEQKVGKQIGDIVAVHSKDYKEMQASKAKVDDASLQLVKAIKKNKETGKDSSRLIHQLAVNYGNITNDSDIVKNLDRTALQNIADWAGVALDVLTAGSYGGLSKGSGKLVKEAPSIIKIGSKEAAKKAVREGAALGAGYGAQGYLSEEKDPSLVGGTISAAVGAAGGALIAKGMQSLGRLGRAMNKKSMKVADDATESVVNKVIKENTYEPVIDLRKPEKPPKIETPEGMKRSSFSENVETSPVTSPELSKEIKENPVFYDVERNPEVLGRARERVAKNPIDAENFVLTATEPSAEHTATAIELIKKMQDEKNFEGALRVADDVSLKLTKAGQAIQAAKLYEHLSPESVLVKAKTFIRKENQKANIFQKKKELTEEGAQLLYDTAKRMQVATGEAKTELANEIASILADYQHNSWGKKISSIQTQAQLLNPKTQVRNVVGNELFYRLERISQLIATPIDMARSVLTGTERTVTFTKHNQSQYWKDWFSGFKSGWNQVQKGPDSQFQLPNKTFDSKWNPFYWGEKAVGASLKSFDYAAYNRARLETIGDFAYLRAKKEGATGKELKELTQKYIDKADDAILEIADQYGKYVTFQDDNMISRGAIATKKGLNFGKDFGLGDLVLKYPKTPGALLARAMEYSPAGFLKSAYQIAKPVIMGKTKSAAENRELAMTVSRAIAGTLGFTGLGYYLADKGFITGRKSKDKDVASLQQSTGQGKYQMNLSAIRRWVMSGFKNTAIKAGDYLYTYDWAQPVAVSLSVGANMNAQTSGKEAATGIGESLSSGASTLVEQPLLTGLTRLFGYGDPIGGTQAVLEGTLSSFTPTVANQFRQYMDNQSRAVQGDTSLQTAKNLVKNKIPGLAETLPPKYNVMGEPVQNFENPNIFNIFFNPGTLTTLKENPESKLILDLMSSTGETKQVPRVIPDQQTIFGEKVNVDPKDYASLQKYAGERTMMGLEQLLKQQAFNELADDEKVKVISSALSDVSSGVKALLQAKKLNELKKAGNEEKIAEIEKAMKPTEMKNIQEALNYLAAHPDFFNLDMNPIKKEEKEEKKASSFLKDSGGPLLLGAGLALASRGKNDKVLIDEASKLTTKIIDRVLSRGSKLSSKLDDEVSKQFILDLTNSPDLKQVEKDLIRSKLDEMTKSQITKEKIDKAWHDWYQQGYINKRDEALSMIKSRPDIQKESIENMMKRAKEKGLVQDNGDIKVWQFESDYGISDSYTLNKNIAEDLLEKANGEGRINYQFFSKDDILYYSEFEDELIAKSYEVERIKPMDVKINVQEFAEKVKMELLPLNVKKSSHPIFSSNKYEDISLPAELKGNIKDYGERIYESPIKTSAGGVHFSENTTNYFGHTRIEDMADNKTRRVIEVQSDLYQKGRLENEIRDASMRKFHKNADAQKSLNEANREFSKLKQYNDPTAHFRMVREEIKQAAKDGKTKLQFPTGETAMKIEGLGRQDTFRYINENGNWGDTINVLTKNDIGKEVGQTGIGGQTESYSKWIITDVLGDGKFKAVPKNVNDAMNAWEVMDEGKTLVNKQTGVGYMIHKGETAESIIKEMNEKFLQNAEQFDISGKVDTNNPIYKFYEKELGRYLKNNFDAKNIVDDRGVQWMEVSISPKMNAPVEAFGGFIAGSGIQQGADENKDGKKSSFLKDGLPTIGAAAGLAIASRGKKTGLLTEAAEKLLSKGINKLTEKTAAKEGSLIALHSTTKEALQKILDKGKIFGPSVALRDIKVMGKERIPFGEYHVVINKKAIDPSDKNVLLFTDDAYTPRYVTDQKSLNRLKKELDYGLDPVGAEHPRGREALEREAPEVAFTKRISNLLELDKERNRITSREGARNDYMDRRLSLEKDLKEVAGLDAQEAEQALIDIIRNDGLIKTEYAKEALDDITGKDIPVAKVEKFISGIKEKWNNIKVEYFEGKLVKAVDLKKEVDAVIIPDDADVDLIYQIKKSGRKVYQYNTKGEGKTLGEAVREASQYAFSIGIIPAAGVITPSIKKMREKDAETASSYRKNSLIAEPSIHTEMTPKKEASADATRLIEKYVVREAKKKQYGGDNPTIGNIDLTTNPYASNPDHVKSIRNIYNTTKDFTIQRLAADFKRLGSPLQYITDDIGKALEHYEITPGEFAAVIRQDSRYGTTGKGARTKNPGNIGNDDTGRLVPFDTWLEGSIAAIRNLAERKVNNKI